MARKLEARDDELSDLERLLAEGGLAVQDRYLERLRELVLLRIPGWVASRQPDDAEAATIDERTVAARFALGLEEDVAGPGQRESAGITR